MEQPAGASQLRSTLTRLGRRTATVGLAAALLAVALSGLLPDRLQLLFAYACVAFALVCVAGLVSLAGDARLSWRGVSPVVAIVLGVIAGGLPGFLTNRGPDSEDRGARRPVTAATTRRVSAEPPPTVAVPSGPPPIPPRAVARPAARSLDPVLLEIATILNQRARPVLDSLYGSLTAAAGYDSIDPGISSELESSATALAEAEASLERIEADNPDLAAELDGVMGNSRALAGLNSSLSQFTRAPLAARGSGTGQLRRLASTVHATLQWVDAFDQRVASAQQAGAIQ